MPTSKRQRQRENRAKKIEAQRKVDRRRRIRRRAVRFGSVAGVVALVLVVGSLIGSNASDSTTTTSVPAITTTTAPEAGPQGYADYRALPTACGGEAPRAVEEMTFGGPEDQGIAPDARVTATLATSCGEIVLDLDPAEAPETVNSFVFLARQGYFNGSVFHRIMGTFMIQGGDPTATGRGGPGYVIDDEFPPAGHTYGRGTLAMANSGPGTTGGQFFIVTADDAGLPPSYSVFGRAVDSDATLDAIASITVTNRPGATGPEPSLPLEAVYIESVTIQVDG